MEHLEVGYALTNRSKCPVCYKLIVKNDLKIGIIQPRSVDARFDKKQWFHLNCLNVLPNNKDFDIISIYSLREEDQKRVKDRIKELQNKKSLKKQKQSLKVEAKVELQYDDDILDEPQPYFKQSRIQNRSWRKFYKDKERKDLWYDY